MSFGLKLYFPETPKLIRREKIGINWNPWSLIIIVSFLHACKDKAMGAGPRDSVYTTSVANLPSVPLVCPARSQILSAFFYTNCVSQIPSPYGWLGSDLLDWRRVVRGRRKMAENNCSLIKPNPPSASLDTIGLEGACVYAFITRMVIPDHSLNLEGNSRPQNSHTYFQD